MQEYVNGRQSRKNTDTYYIKPFLFLELVTPKRMSGLHRFLTKRERHKKHDKEVTTGSYPNYRGLFASTLDGSKDEEKKIKTLERQIAQKGIAELKAESIQYALRTNYANGDVEKALEMVSLLEDSIEGVVREYTPNTKLLGAENREGVTCYVDALLFAMFARLDCFEAILYKNFSDEPRQKLVITLRLWVNILRSGKLITTDITKHLQDALSECGWQDAAELKQQDVSEAFSFITGKLELPLLTLKMDIYHTGKEDAADDHKFINERLLEVAIPPAQGDQGSLTLEDCLEAYFNNRIEVKRYLERRSTLSSVKSFDSAIKGFAAHVEAAELNSPGPSPILSTSSRIDEATPSSPITDINPSPILPNQRTSIVQERFIPDKDGIDEESKDFKRSSPRHRLRKGSVRKEVMMPAWQFFSLIPWYTDNTPTNDAQVAAHFSSKRPILGLCLKRYSVLPTGRAIRLHTYIDVPIEIGLPHFIQDDKMDEEGPIYGNFKLSLQAVVCHRGNSVDSGHYIALVRGASANAAPSSLSVSDENTPPQADASRHWMRFDDLAEERISMVDIEQALKEESPYLLFYQILPISDDIEEAHPLDYSQSDDDQGASVSVGQVWTLPSLSESNNDGQSERATSSSARPSFETMWLETLLSPPAYEVESKKSAASSGGAEGTIDSGNTKASAISFSDPSTLKTEDGRNSFLFSRQITKGHKSRSHTRENSENRLSATLSRLTGRRSREKLQNESNTADGEEDEAIRMIDHSPNDQHRQMANGIENKPKRAKQERDKHLGKKRAEKPVGSGNKPERECTVM
ncbi:Ubiquitin carboxyl-terminal hydrolase domain containing protein [Elaphomyces granulatus]